MNYKTTGGEIFKIVPQVRVDSSSQLYSYRFAIFDEYDVALGADVVEIHLGTGNSWGEEGIGIDQGLEEIGILQIKIDLEEVYGKNKCVPHHHFSDKVKDIKPHLFQDAFSTVKARLEERLDRLRK